MSAEATLPLTPGELVAGKYLIDRVLGVGGMGAVFAAADQQTGERVAIKCLLPIFADNHDVRTRFLREGSATMRLQSEHIAQVSGTGTLDDGVPYIVMEHLDGRDLRTVVRGSGPLDVSTAAAYVGQVCAALAEAHALGIVHRDLKPANLFLTRRPSGAALIKVLDFGIAKYTSASLLGDQVEMTKTQAVLGSRAYMSPEQMLRPKEVDARADIWSLGVILYFFVTGKNPFTSDTTEGMIMRIVAGAAEPLQTALPDVPSDFEAIVMRCLSKRREDRYSNVTELARALAPFGRHVPDRATMELDNEPERPRGMAPPEPSGPTIRGYSMPDPSQPGLSQHGLSRASGSRTSASRVAPGSRAALLGSMGALLAAIVVVVSFIMSTRNATAHIDDASLPAAAQPPAPIAVAASAPAPIPSAAVVAVAEDPPPAPLGSASAAVVPAASIAPQPAVKPLFGKMPGAKPGSRRKVANAAADTPW
ncbi:MAG: serine/threonine-protein kinase [Byssovorax sp.]